MSRPVLLLFYIFVSFLTHCLLGEDVAHLASLAQAEQAERRRCGYNLIKLWTAEIAHTPFAASPLITDVDGDGHLDIVAGPLSEAHTVIGAETGKTLPGTRWPAQRLDSSILASPLQYDIDGDGSLDILFVTSSGELLFYTANGTLLKEFTLELPPAYVQQDWYNQVIQASGQDVYSYVKVAGNSGPNQDKKYLPVDAHVMATPVIADLNNDGLLQELVLPVSYFFDEEDYRLPENFEHINNINESSLGQYVVSGITVVNLSTLQIAHSLFLDITTKKSGFPAYVLFSPTVVDLDREGGDMEIVVGTSAGNIHVLDTGHGYKDRTGFPYSMGTIHGQVTVADVNKDDHLEIIAIDNSGNVVCLNDDGTLTWEVEISGSASPGSRLIDVDDDGYLDVIIPTDEGDIYAIHGVKGHVLDKWPVKIGHPILANVLATHVSQERTTLDLVFLTNDGSLHVMSTDQSCRTHYPIGETSLVQVLSHDLVSQSDGPELLVATNDGTLICLGSGEDSAVNAHALSDQQTKKDLTLALPSETKSYNDFSFAEEKLRVYAHQVTRLLGEVTGSHFDLTLDIDDPLYKPNKQKPYKYLLRVYFGSNLLHQTVYQEPGTKTLSIQSFLRPSHGHVTLVLTNQNGQVATDMFSVRFNQVILEDLQWLLMAPFVTMVIILLVTFGFPSKDLLPYTFQSKSK